MLDATGNDTGMFGPGDGADDVPIARCSSGGNRGWDNGRGVDSGRALGSWQKGTLVGFDTSFDGVWAVSTIDSDGPSGRASLGADAYDTSEYPKGRITGTSSGVNQSLPGNAGNNGFSGVTRMRNISRMFCIRAY